MGNDTKDKIKHLFILDEETKFLYQDNPNSKPIFSEIELDEALSEQKNDLKGVVIIAELDWEGKHLQHFYGLELAKKIRLEYNCLFPTVICSSFSEDFIMNTPIPALDFYKSPGTYYLHINDFHKIKTYLNSRESIDEETVIDITESFGDQKGIISNVIHDLKNKRKALFQTKNPSDLLAIVKEQFDRLTLFFRGSEKELESIKGAFVKDVINGNVDQSITHFEQELLKLIPQEGTGSLVSYNAKWKILFLDDEEDIRSYVKDEFAKRGLACDVVANKNELDSRLEEDEKYNYYTLLICDYRLKEANSEKLLPKQGYSILKEVFLKRSNYLSLFALSSMNSKVLLKLRERFNMKVWTFSKDDIQQDAGFNIFCNKVIEEGEKMFETICNLPGDEYDAWINPQPLPDSKAKTIFRKEPFRNYYRAFRMAENFEEQEKKISKKAKKLYIDRKKFKHDVDSIIPHQYAFTSKLKKGVEDEDAMKKFKHKLIGRRLYLALRFKGKIYDLEKLALLLHRNPKTLDPNKSLETGYFSQHLCMPEDLERMPILFPEEKFWLEKDIGFDLDAENRKTYNEVWEIIREECLDIDNLPWGIDSLQDLKSTLENLQRTEYWEEVANKVRIKMQQILFSKDRKERWLQEQKEQYAGFKNRYSVSGVMDLLNEFELVKKESDDEMDRDKTQERPPGDV